MQPLYVDEHGTVRFVENKVVRWLITSGRLNLNDVPMELPEADLEQFWQMLGHSVSGFGDVSFVRPETVTRADRLAARLRSKRSK